MVMMMNEEEEEEAEGRERCVREEGERAGDWQVTSDTGGGSQGCHVGRRCIVTSGRTYLYGLCVLYYYHPLSFLRMMAFRINHHPRSLVLDPEKYTLIVPLRSAPPDHTSMLTSPNPNAAPRILTIVSLHPDRH